jgi:hypothetical protein
MLSYSNLNFPYQQIIIGYLQVIDRKEYVRNLPFKPESHHFKTQILF